LLNLLSVLVHEMHPADIKAALQKKGSSCAQIARKQNVDRSMVSQVVCGRGTSRRVAFEISRVIGRPVQEIWPGKYVPKIARSVAHRSVKRRAG